VFRYHFHIVLCAFLLGVAIQTFAPFSLPSITWLFLLVGGGLLITLKENLLFSGKAFLVLLCVTFFSLGLLRMEVASWAFGHSSLVSSVGQEITIEGTVSKEPDVRERTQHLMVETAENTVLVTTDSFIPVSYGDTVTVKGELSIPESFKTDLGREFRYDTYLLAKGVEYTVSFAEVSVLEERQGNRAVGMLLDFKKLLLSGIETSLGEPYAGLGAGLLLGVKQALGDELEASFRTAGLIHIVVLSGYNIMLVVAFVMYLLSFFFRKRMRIIVGMVAIVGFALMVGLSATVVRASVMAVLLLTAEAFGRTYDVTRSLLFAGAVMVFLNPYLLLYDIGFQLSFMATLGLVLFLPRFEAMVAEGGSITIREYLFSTVATQIAVLPLLLYHIGEVSIVSVIVNVLVLPIVPIAMLATFIAGMITIGSQLLAIPFAFVAHYALAYIILMATWFAALPFAAIAVPAFDAWLVPILYIAMAIGYMYVVRVQKEKVGDSLSEPPTTPSLFR
jgi:competence protein ComEC